LQVGLWPEFSVLEETRKPDGKVLEAGNYYPDKFFQKFNPDLRVFIEKSDL
jgi:hypothetical protein